MRKVVIHAGSIGTNIVTDVAHITTPAVTQAGPAPVRALFLAANPPATSRLRIDAELRNIDQAIQRGAHRERFELAVQLAVRVQDLQSHLLRYQPTLLHFAGHGEAGALVFEDATGANCLLRPADLRAALGQLGRQLQCVVLNACFTEPQARDIAAEIPCVIATSRAITDGAAIAFASGLYEALAHGQNVKTAFDLGCQRIALADDTRSSRDVVSSQATLTALPILLGKDDPRHIRLC